MKQAMAVLTSSQSNEWLTPPSIISKITKVLDREIDLDPASTPLANKIVNAKRFFTEEDDGLSKPWSGNVFLNPPYGKTGNKSNQEIWGTKLLDEWHAERVEAAILLTKTVPGYEWWDWMFTAWPGPMCITYGRLAFIRPEWVTFDDRKKPARSIIWPDGDNRSKAASSFWYVGRNNARFAREFAGIGRIIPERIAT